MSLIGKEVKSLKAIKGLAADKITADHLTAIQAELKDEFEIEGIEVSAAGTLAAVQANLDTATEANTTAVANGKKLTEDLAAANKKITELEGKLKATPAATTTEPAVVKDKIPADDEQEDIDTIMTNKVKDQHGL